LVFPFVAISPINSQYFFINNQSFLPIVDRTWLTKEGKNHSKKKKFFYYPFFSHKIIKFKGFAQFISIQIILTLYLRTSRNFWPILCFDIITRRTLRLPSLGRFDKAWGKIRIMNLTRKFSLILDRMSQAEY